MRRRALAVIAGFVAAIGLVTLDPSAPSAMGTVVIPDPVAWPSSTLTAVANQPYGTAGSTAVQPSAFTANNWNRMLTANPRALPIAPTTAGWASKLGLVAKGAGWAGLYVMAFDLTYSLTSVGMNIMGIESNGAMCDISNFFGGQFGCAVGNLPEYTVNMDVLGLEPGWLGGNQVTATTSYWYSQQGQQSQNMVSMSQGVSVSDDGTQWLLEVVSSPFGPQYAGPGGGTGPFTRLGWRTCTVTVSTGVGSCGSVNQGAGYIAANVVYTRIGPLEYLQGGVLTRLDRVEVGAITNMSWSSNVGFDVVGAWYPSGHPNRPLLPETNPVRWWQTTYECTDGRTGFVLSDPWREADPEWPAIPEAPCMAGIKRLTVDQITDNWTTTRILDWEAPPEFIDTVTDYPQCVDGLCRLLMDRLDTVTGRWLSCFANPSLCVDWWPEYQANPTTARDKYRCTYAGSTVDLGECKVYAHVFSDGELSDPETGDKPTSDPLPPGDPNPEPGPEPDNACPPPFTWTSLINPWWYWKSTVCALEWAFVPPTATAITPPRTAGTVIEDVTGVVDKLGDLDMPAGTCGVIVDRPVSAFQGGRVRIDTCEEPWTSAGPLRGLIGAGLLVITVLTAVQVITRAIGIRSLIIAEAKEKVE